MPMICYTPKSFQPDTLRRIDQANQIIDEYQAQGFTLTLRQLYYQFVSRDLIANTVRSYKVLGSILNDARLAGLIDWDALEDRTRNLRSSPHWSSPKAIVSACAAQFAVDLWDSQGHYVEVWIEKDALIGVIEGICTELDVPYFACRGYTSQSEMWGAAQRLIEREDAGLQTSVIHLGDHDPSGIDMTRDIQDRLELFGSSAVVHRIALLYDQVQRYSPPPNPAKTTDARYRGYVRQYGGESWELDALEPNVIVELVREAVEARIDREAWQEALNKQTIGRDRLTNVSDRWDDLAAYLGNGDARRRCERCSAPLSPGRSDSRFCSPACKQAAYRTRRAERVTGSGNAAKGTGRVTDSRNGGKRRRPAPIAAAPPPEEST